MNRIQKLGIAAAFLVSVGVVFGQRVAPNRPGKRPAAYTKGMVIPGSKGGRVFMPFDAVTPWAVTVDWSLTLNADDTTLYQKMATAVSGYANIPGDRTSFYSSLNNPPNLVINGWSGMVNNVQTADGGGYVVTVAVFPDLTTAAYGEHTTVSSEYSEQFGVDSNGNVTYMTFLDPAGMAGQMPASMGTAG